MKIDFGEQGCDNCDWFVVVDGVMGGRSSGKLNVLDDSIELAGTISLANRGGFSSIRTPYKTADLSHFSRVKIRYKSIGQSFAFTLNNYRRFYLPRFKHALPITDGKWSEMTLQFSDFKKVRFSEQLGGGPSADELEKVIRLGLISNDKIASDFTLEVDYIEFQ